MKSSLLTKVAASIALMLVIVSAVFAPIGTASIARAQGIGPQQQQPYNPNTSVPFVGAQNSSSTPDLDAEDAETAKNNSQKDNSLDCGANIFCGMVQFFGAIFTFVTNLVVTVVGLIADFSLWYSIQSGSYGLINPFLETGWKLVRDFTYILFIFAILVLGFNLIFNVDTRAEKGYTGFGMEPKRTFMFVVIMALVVSFSFFFSRTVIEVGNVMATAIYNRITTAEADLGQAQGNSTNINDGSQSQKNVALLGSPSTWFSDNQFLGMKSVSLGILNKINPQQLIVNTAEIESHGWVWKSYDVSFYILYLFLSVCVAVFNLVLTYIFVSMAILFLGRYIGLAFAIILSPIAFVSVVVPGLANKEYIGFQDWISELVGLTFVAPVYLVFVYLTILFLNTNLFGGKVEGYILVATIVLIKLMLTALVLLKGKSIATSMAGHVGKFVGGMAGTLASVAVGAATGGTAFLARNTIGRAGAAIATNGSLARIAGGGANQSIQDAQNRLSSSIRNFGVGKYRLGNTKLGGRFANSVKNAGFANVSASSAQGLRQFGKNLYSVNPLDRSIGGMSARRAAGMLGTMTGNQALNQVLAKDYVGQLKKKQARDRMLDIEASKNKKKTITNVVNNAFSSGLASASMGGGGSTNPNATGSGPITVTGPNTGPIPSALGWTGAKGPVPGSKLPNDFNGMKLAAPVVTAQGSAPASNPVSNSNDDTDPPNPPAGGAGVLPNRPPNDGGQKPLVSTPRSQMIFNRKNNEVTIKPKSLTAKEISDELFMVSTDLNNPKYRGDREALNKKFDELMTQKRQLGSSQNVTSVGMNNGNGTNSAATNATELLAGIQGTVVDATAVTESLVSDQGNIEMTSGPKNENLSSASTESVQVSEQTPITESVSQVSAPVTTAPVSPKKTFGDGSANTPTYTAAQQERILNKAIASQTRGQEVQAGIDRKQEAIAQAKQVEKTKEAERAETARIQQEKIQQQEVARAASEQLAKAAERQAALEKIAAQKQAEQVKKEITATKQAFEQNRNQQAPLKPSATTESKIEGVMTASEQASKVADSNRESVISGAEKIHTALDNAGYFLARNNADYGQSVSHDTVRGIEHAKEQLANVIANAKSGAALDHSAIHDSLVTLDDALKRVDNHGGEITLNRDHLENSMKVMGDIHDALSSGLDAIHNGLGSKASSDLLSISHSVKDSVNNAADYLYGKQQTLNRYQN